MQPTFADLLTPTGVLIAASAVLALVEIIKAGLPAIDRRVSGATIAFALSAVLYGLTAVAIPQATPDGYLAVAFAWIACATSAMGIRSGAQHLGDVRDGTAGLRAETKTVVVESHTDEDESEAIEDAELDIPLEEEPLPANGQPA